MSNTLRLQYSRFLPALGVLGLLSFSQPVRASLILDSFSTTQQVMRTLPDPSIPSYFDTSTNIATPGASVLGGRRSLAILTTDGEPDDIFRLRVSSAGSGTVRFSTDSSIKGKGLITYDGSTTGVSTGATAGNFNKPTNFQISGLNFLTIGNGISLIGYADNNGLPVTFTVYKDANNYASGIINVPGSNNATFAAYSVLFSNFVKTGSLSLNDILADVKAFTVELNASSNLVTPGTDAVIDYIAITGTPIPEPATFALLGGSLVGLGLLRRRFAK
jgi:hypothetical protein